MDIIRNNTERLSGLEQLHALIAANIPPPINKTLNYRLIEFEEGRAVFEGHPDQSVYNPIGAVHGGYAATLLDTACGCAVHSTLTADQGCTTLELKVAYHRPLTEASGPVRAEGSIVSIGRRTGFAEAKLTDRNGKVCATATSTLLIFPLDAAGSSPPAASGT